MDIFTFIDIESVSAFYTATMCLLLIVIGGHLCSLYSIFERDFDNEICQFKPPFNSSSTSRLREYSLIKRLLLHVGDLFKYFLSGFSSVVESLGMELAKRSVKSTTMVFIVSVELR